MKETLLRKEAKVGLFVVIGVTALLISILLFGGDRMFLTPSYRLRLQLKDVQGLGPGSVVSLAGLRIGNVKRVELNPESGKLEVILRIEKQYQERITTDATATLKTQGALGDRYVYVTPHVGSGQPLPDGAVLPTAESADLFEMITAKGAEFGNVIEVIKEVRQFVHNLNEHERSAVFMENMVTMSHNLNGLMIEGRAMMKDLRGSDNDSRVKEASMHLANILRKIDRGEGTLGALINDPSLHDRLMGMLGENPRNRYMKSLLRQSIKDGQ